MNFVLSVVGVGNLFNMRITIVGGSGEEYLQFGVEGKAFRILFNTLQSLLLWLSTGKKKTGQ